MSAIRPRDLLSDALLGQLGGTAEQPGGRAAGGGSGAVAGDIVRLAEAG